ILLNLVEGLFGHQAVSSPLATEYADQARRRIEFDLLVADQFLSVGYSLGGDQRPNTSEPAEHLLGCEWQVQIRIELAEEILDFITVHYHFFARSVPGVGSAYKKTAIPRNR